MASAKGFLQQTVRTHNALIIFLRHRGKAWSQHCSRSYYSNSAIKIF